MFDYQELRERIRIMYGTEANFSQVIKIPPATLSFKLNGVSEFRQCEILKVCDALKIKPKEIPKYFFCRKSSENLNSKASPQKAAMNSFSERRAEFIFK